MARTPANPLSTLTPRGETVLRGSRWSSDENLDLIAHILDDWLRIPGTRIRFGLEGILGLIPGLGDFVAGIASLFLLVAAWVRGVPYVTLARMAANIGIAVLIGAIPLFGAAFDTFFKPNRRNFRLLQRHLREPRRHTWKDWVFFAVLAAILFAVLLAPLVVLILVARKLTGA